MITFGELIFTERVRRNLSLREAAARIGISHTYLASLERDCDPRTGNPLTPSPDVLLKLCNAYGLANGELAHYFTLKNWEQKVKNFCSHLLVCSSIFLQEDNFRPFRH